MFNNVKFTNGATKTTATIIINKIKNNLGYREQTILENLTEVEQNNNVPEGYTQYVFYNHTGEGFQAGKYANGSYGITL